MNRSTVLLIDAIVSFVLGVVLLVFPGPLVELLGLPTEESRFYHGLLGAVVIGIAIALLLEQKRRPRQGIGLGLGGAMLIDLCAALFLAAWLILGDTVLPLRGRIVLWAVVVVLLVVSALGADAHRRQSD